MNGLKDVQEFLGMGGNITNNMWTGKGQIKGRFETSES